MDNPITVTINRTGDFSVQPEQFTGNQCGRTERVEYSFDVTIEATDKKLIEPDMFVLDRMLVEKYFVDKYEAERHACSSCEIMCLEAVNYFKSLFVGEDAPHNDVEVRRITVRIIGDVKGYIESQWVK